MDNKLIAIIGMGPGISYSVAERFAKEGYAVAMFSRNEGRLSLFQELLEKQLIYSRYYLADAGKPAELRAAMDKMTREMGHPDVLVYNASKFKTLHILDETAEAISEDLLTNVGGALEAVKMALPAMKARNQGTILLTGGGLALHPNPGLGSLAIGKTGLRSLAAQLHDSLAGTGIKVATITVAGFVSKESSTHHPDRIADLYWQLHTTPADQLDFEVTV